MILASGCGERAIDQHLSEAAGVGDVQQIKRLLSQGANVNSKNHSLAAWTPLFWSLFERQDEATLALLAAGADPNLRDGTGKLPLEFTLGPDDRSVIIRALILAGAKTEEFTTTFERLPAFDPNRIAFEEAIRLRTAKSKTAAGPPATEQGTNRGPPAKGEARPP